MDLFDKGTKADYDAWEELEDLGWGWDGLIPYCKKSMTFHPSLSEIAVKYRYTWDIENAYGENGPI
ncbi:hypothetical protein K469DRAFT_713238 [Zopfia rhizophila CBS 207.26]|uniref:Glucose-methanol-choline oxidoreductase N-terminal domain-containing protein n=1 Tax=Zopfia rhizophila CBS 207.26 TaxID=1314779 RepID=A0A6A6DTC1_9PEZI|nr:hypothetical protein K469DRAFT_713238 [Zopfia rhizophila CBS 207.26]